MTNDALRCTVVVPIRSFTRAKGRLAEVLTEARRADLARVLAARLLIAAQGLPVVVACEDDEVADWASSAGAEAVRTDGHGLSDSVAFVVGRLAAAGVARVIVAHADLADPPPLLPLGTDDGIVLVPDRVDDGTNLISLPTSCSFTFAYGPGSFERHLASAAATGLPVRVERGVPGWAWDVDLPDDLRLPAGFAPLELP